MERVKNKGGRPRGSKTVTKLSAGGLLELFDGCYTAEGWARRFKALTPENQFKYRAQLEPRAKEESPASTFVMITDGLGSKLGKAYCPRCGWNSDDGTAGLRNHNGEVPIPPRRPSKEPYGSPVDAAKLENEGGHGNDR